VPLFAIKVQKCRVGVGAQGAPIAGIAVIADIARDRKGKTVISDHIEPRVFGPPCGPAASQSVIRL